MKIEDNKRTTAKTFPGRIRAMAVLGRTLSK